MDIHRINWSSCLSLKDGGLLVSYQNPHLYGKISFISLHHQKVFHFLVYHKCHKLYLINIWQCSGLRKPYFQKDGRPSLQNWTPFVNLSTDASCACFVYPCIVLYMKSTTIPGSSASHPEIFNARITHIPTIVHSSPSHCLKWFPILQVSYFIRCETVSILAGFIVLPLKPPKLSFFSSFNERFSFRLK